MSVPLDLQIRRRLAQFIAGENSLDTFEDWFVPNVLSMADRLANRSAEELAYEIELRLAEYAHGDWTADELKEHLRPLVAPVQTAPSETA